MPRWHSASNMAERGANVLPFYRLFYGLERIIFGTVLYAAVLRHKETPLPKEQGTPQCRGGRKGPGWARGAQALGIALQEECFRGGDVLDLGGVDGLIGGMDGALWLLHAVESDLRVGAVSYTHLTLPTIYSV